MNKMSSFQGNIYLMNPLEPEWLSFLILISWFVWDGFKLTLGCEPGCPTKGDFWPSAVRGARWFRGHIFLQKPADNICPNPCIVPCWGLVFGLCPTHLLCCSLHNSPVHISFDSSLLSLCLCSRSMRNKLFCVASFSKCFLLPQLTQTSPPPSVPCELRLLVHKHVAFPIPQFSSLANSLLPGALCHLASHLALPTTGPVCRHWTRSFPLGSWASSSACSSVPGFVSFWRTLAPSHVDEPALWGWSYPCDAFHPLFLQFSLGFIASRRAANS